MSESIRIDVYHPLVSDDHYDICASLCTNFSDEDSPDGCTVEHNCWCPDGGLSYAEFQAKHPDVTVAEV